VAATLHARARRRASARVLAPVAGGWRNSIMPPQKVGYRDKGVRDAKNDLVICYAQHREGHFEIQAQGQEHRAQVMRTGDHDIELDLDGVRSTVTISRIGDRVLVHGMFGDHEFIELPRFPRADRADFRGGLMAPMPGRVLSIAVKPGQVVEKGQLLLVLEAMKMEHRITAPTPGTVTAVKVSENEQVANGAMLVMLEESKDA
jgi:propionyl-CoA carboxylase alpha chain